MATNTFRLVVVAAGLGTAVSTAGAQEVVNGYAYAAPSYYLSPPILVPPPVIVGPPMVVLARPGYAPVTVPPPVFLETAYVPYDPVWPYAYFGAPGPYIRETVRTRPREVEYKVKAYAPGGKSVYTYEAETKRNGETVVRQRIR